MFIKMPGTSVSEDIEPPNATYDEISELQRKIHLLCKFLLHVSPLKQLNYNVINKHIQ